MVQYNSYVTRSYRQLECKKDYRRRVTRFIRIILGLVNTKMLSTVISVLLGLQQKIRLLIKLFSTALYLMFILFM
jgi:hypothetical protein